MTEIGKEALHRLVDDLPDDAEQLEKVRESIIRAVSDGRPRDEGDPVLQALMAAPEDDEPVMPEQAAMLDRRRESAARGRTVSDEELARRLGL